MVRISETVLIIGSMLNILRLIETVPEKVFSIDKTSDILLFIVRKNSLVPLRIRFNPVWNALC
jgi:hypothetical protein